MLYYLFLFVAIAGYILPAWVVPLAAQAGQSGAWYLADLWLVRPQVRLLLLILPPSFSLHWPGAVSGPLQPGHRIVFSIFYGLLGWISVRLVSRQFYSDRALRVIWLGIYWAATLLFMQLVSFLMTYFGALPKS